ncbi:MAG: hypothetical protein AAF715_13345 [Myxococcota bacterium]
MQLHAELELGLGGKYPLRRKHWAWPDAGRYFDGIIRWPAP